MPHLIAAGANPTDAQVGDFILCHRRGLASACVCVGQRVRFRGKRRPYAYWSHAALIVSPHGDLVEALTAGVVRSHVERYRDVEYMLVRVGAAKIDQQQILRFADRVVNRTGLKCGSTWRRTGTTRKRVKSAAGCWWPNSRT